MPFMRSAGISVLLETHQRAAPHTAVFIVAPSRTTLRPLQVTGLDTVLDLYLSAPTRLTRTVPANDTIGTPHLPSSPLSASASRRRHASHPDDQHQGPATD
ncbi:hypothetical protein [Actinophytocola sp.]|uniref:hypothetical protein n=1 Tax=Actinophytocola sp. TaxID=1872138 RepID=UPI0039C8A5C6